MLVSPALTGGARIAAQAVERSDVAGRGVLRVTFDPRLVGWDAQFVNRARLGLGVPLTGDTVGAAAIPIVARLEQDVRTASGLSGFVANLGKSLLSVRQEQRTTPITAELGLTDRLSLSVMVPIVRVATRAHLTLSPAGANLGPSPRLATGFAADTSYGVFFAQFDSSLARFDQNIAGGQYGCAANPSCPARDSSTYWHTVRDALHRTVYGAVSDTIHVGAPFMPLDTSDAGRAIALTVAGIQQDLATFGGVAGFAHGFLLADDSMSVTWMTQAIVDSAHGFGYRALPFRNSFRLGLGDVEVAAKYRLAAGAHYAAALVALVRLPTAQRDSASDWLRQSLGDHQTDVEGRLVQELIVGPVWLNVALRGGIQRAGTQVRRVAPPEAMLVPFAATTELRWDPGDYAGVDIAPLLRFARRFAAGVTAGYWTKQPDRYAFRSMQDSLDLAARLGAPTSAAVLDQGTAERRLRLGVAVTYVGPTVEGGFSIEQTVSGGAGAVTPAATVYRIVLRTSRRLF